jgi:hypothetical protein
LPAFGTTDEDHQLRVISLPPVTADLSRLLAKTDAAKGRKPTSYPSVRTDLVAILKYSHAVRSTRRETGRAGNDRGAVGV